MPRRLVLIAHDDGPRDDRAARWAAARDFAVEVVRPFRGEPLAPPGGIAGSILYGGPFPVYETDRHPFLRDEYRWIESCLRADIPLLGICQGAQQIAHHLGARVGPHPDSLHEFGYYEIRPRPGTEDFLPAPIRVAQSHYHGFDIPAGAEHLAESDLYPNQAFRLGPRVYALQFHAEVTPLGFRRWQAAPWAAFGRPGAQSREEQDRLMPLAEAEQGPWFEAFLSRLFGVPA